TGGSAGLGCGLFNNRGILALTKVTVARYAANVGGGIANLGNLSLAQVTLRANFTRFAPALFNGHTARLIRRWGRIGNSPVLRRIRATRSATVMLAVVAELRTHSVGPIPRQGNLHSQIAFCESSTRAGPRSPDRAPPTL